MLSTNMQARKQPKKICDGENWTIRQFDNSAITPKRNVPIIYSGSVNSPWISRYMDSGRICNIL